MRTKFKFPVTTTIRQYMRPRQIALPLAIFGLSVLLAAPVRGASSYWDSNGATAGAGGATPTGTWGADNYWSTSSAGTAATAAWTSGDTAVFSAGTDATGTFTITVSGSQTAAGVTVEEGTVTLSGGTLTLSGAGAITVGASRKLTIGSVIAGSAGLTKLAAGELVLTGVNTFSGNLTNRGGTITFDSNESSSTGMIVVDNTIAATLRSTQPLTTLTNNILLRASVPSVEVAASTGKVLELSGAISGPHPWIVNGAGTVKLSGPTANTFSGALNLAQGMLLVAKDFALGTTLNGTVISNGATLGFEGGFEYTPTESVLVHGGGAISNLSSDNIFDGVVTLLGNATVGAAADSLGFNGSISGGYKLTKVGSGEVDLYALNNNYSNTLVSAGTLGVWYPANAGTNLVTVSAGARLYGNGIVPGGVDLSGEIEPGVAVDVLDTGSQTWRGGGEYNWDLNDAAGSAGASPGWDLLNISGGLDITATSGSPFTIHLQTLETSFNSPGSPDNFDNSLDYAWTIATTTSGITGFDPSKFVIDAANFVGPGFGSFVLELANSDKDLVLRFIHPPYVVTQPASIIRECFYSNATFTVVAAGTGTLGYQWNSNSVPMVDGGRFSGVTTPTLTISTLEPSDAMSFTCTITNAFGTTNSAAATLTVVDTVPPTISCPTDFSVECTSPWTFGSPTAGDTCTSASISILNTVTNPGCGQTFTATRTWRATDVAGNFADCSQTVTVQDTTAPTIVCVSDKSVECGTAWTFDAPSASDTCGTNSIAVVMTYTNATCGDTFVASRVWRAMDACGNLSLTCTQTVTVVDTTAPTITCVADKQVESTSAWTFDAPSASDSCGSSGLTTSVVMTYTNATCGNAYVATRVWKAVDGCANESLTCTQVVTVADTTAPTIVCVPDKQVESTSAWTFDPPHASDTGLGEVTVYDNSVNDMGTRFPTGTNEVGNEIILAGTERYLQSFAFEYWATNTQGGPFAGSVRLRLRANDGPTFNGYPTPGTVLYDSGNFAVPATPRSTVVYDEYDLWVGGVVPLSAALPNNVTWTVQFSELGPYDEAGLDIYEPPVVGQAYGDYWINTNGTWTLRDSLTVEYDFAALATASSTNVTIAVLSTVTNSTCGAAFVATRTWIATDACGNTSTCQQTVTVVDTTPPVIVCAPDKVVECATAWTFDTPHASDTGLGMVTVYDNSVNDAGARFATGTNEVGNEIILAGSERYLQWFAFEYWGTNTLGGGFVGSVQARLRLRANDGPLYSGYPTPGTVLYDSGSFAVSATPRSTVVFDEYDLWVGGLVPLSAALPNSLTWTVEFSGLGVGDDVGLDIYEPPVVGQAYGDYWINTNGTWELRDSLTVEYDFAALAKASGTNVTITVLSTVTSNTCGNTLVTTRTWVATDACGNSNTCQQTVTVVDTTPPSLTCPATVLAPADAGFCYATGVALGLPITSDTCGSVTVSNDAPAQLPVGTNAVVWTAVDACGNTTTCTQTVVIQDLESPVLVAGTIAPCYTSAALAEAAAIAATTITENCTVTNIAAVAVGSCSATVTVTVTDASGNSAATNYSTRIDAAAPVIGTITASQVQSGSPVNVKDQTCAVAPVLQGIVTITVESTDNCSLANGHPSLTLTNGANWAIATCVATNINTYTYEWLVGTTTASGTWTVTVAASDLCTTTTTTFTLCVNQAQITGLVQLDGFVGTGTVPANSRVVTFVMSGGASTVTNSLLLTNVSGDTFSYTLVNVPAGTTAVSAKTDWNLREKLAVVLDVNNQGVANFVSDGTPGWSDATDHYLRGGDIDASHNNQISFNDYSVLGNNYFTFNAVADINGNGVVNLGDYSILAANWFTFGDPQ